MLLSRIHDKSIVGHHLRLIILKCMCDCLIMERGEEKRTDENNRERVEKKKEGRIVASLLSFNTFQLQF